MSDWYRELDDEELDRQAIARAPWPLRPGSVEAETTEALVGDPRKQDTDKGRVAKINSSLGKRE